MKGPNIHEKWAFKMKFGGAYLPKLIEFGQNIYEKL